MLLTIFHYTSLRKFYIICHQSAKNFPGGCFKESIKEGQSPNSRLAAVKWVQFICHWSSNVSEYAQSGQSHEHRNIPNSHISVGHRNIYLHGSQVSDCCHDLAEVKKIYYSFWPCRFWESLNLDWNKWYSFIELWNEYWIILNNANIICHYSLMNAYFGVNEPNYWLIFLEKWKVNYQIIKFMRLSATPLKLLNCSETINTNSS